MRRFLLCAIFATALVSPAAAQYPDKPIRFIVPQAAGSNTDLYSRLIAADAFLAGTIRRVGGRWLFWNMTGGSARPLSADHYYFP